MSERFIFLMLKTVSQNKNLALLLREGLSFKDIGDLTEGLATEQLIEISTGRITVTDHGRATLESLEKILKKRDKSKWIEIDTNSQIEKMNANEIYLPSKADMSF